MRAILFLSTMLLAVLLRAQAPHLFNYQATARDALGEPLQTQAISVQFLFHENTATGPLVYGETHSATTSIEGLFVLAIGNGTPTVGTMAAIDWSNGPYFLEVLMDPAGGSAFISSGTQQLLSVPYALYAQSTGSMGADDDWVVLADTVHSDGKYVGIGTSDPQALLEVTSDVLVNGITVGRGAGSAPRNVALGDSALRVNTTAQNNTAIGNRTLSKNLGSGAVFNTAVGSWALRENTYGGFNTAVGAQCLVQNTVGIGNTAVGVSAMVQNFEGDFNTAIGNSAMSANGTGSYNTAIGKEALHLNQNGDNNTAVGAYSLHNSTGDGNTALGFNTLYANLAGTDNTGLGRAALYSNTSGTRNTAIARSALFANTTGSNNTAAGNGALFNSNGGNNNTAMGTDALYSMTLANNNVAIGQNAGNNNVQGNGNTYLGYNARPTSSTSFAWSTAIGENSTVTATDQVRIGTNFTASIGGYQAWSVLSDGRMKKNVVEDVHGLDLILKLRPVTYQLDHEALIRATHSDPEQAAELIAQIPDRARNATESGFIAQEVELLAEELGMDFSGVDPPKNSEDLYGLRYSMFVVPLVKAVQEQQDMIAAQQSLLEQQQLELKALRTQLNALLPQGQ